MEVMNIFCLTHCLLCSSQNVFLNIQTTVFCVPLKHTNTFISNCLNIISFLKGLFQDYGCYSPIYCCNIFVISRFCCLTTVEICKQFLASKISFCLLYLHVFVCQQKCRQKSNWIYIFCLVYTFICTPES